MWLSLCSRYISLLSIYIDQRLRFYRFLAIKLERVDIHKYANQLVCIFELYTNGQCCSFNLIPNLRLYVDEKLRYDTFTTYAPKRNDGHFVFWRPSCKWSNLKWPGIVSKCVRCNEDMVKISFLHHQVKYFLSIPLHYCIRQEA